MSNFIFTFVKPFKRAQKFMFWVWGCKFWFTVHPTRSALMIVLTYRFDALY